jgi:hypothetical protein
VTVVSDVELIDMEVLISCTDHCLGRVHGTWKNFKEEGN